MCWGDEGAEAGPLVAREGLRPPHVPCCLAGFSRDYQDDMAEQLLSLKDGLVHPDPAILFHTCHSIAQVPASGRCSSSLHVRALWVPAGQAGRSYQSSMSSTSLPLLHLLGPPSGAQ